MNARAVVVFASVAAAAAAAGTAFAGPTLPAGVVAGPSIEGVSEYSLPNGLRVLLVPDPSKETITVNVTYLVGSRHESYGETGMAHLLEHLMFKGTPSHPKVPDELTSHGCRSNGTTSYDRTNYFETFPASQENLDWALDLEADRMVASFIAAKDLESEMTVVRNEFESGENDPGRVLTQRVLATAYLWHNYGHPTIGSRADIEGVPIERLQNFYRTYYQPDNAVLIVAGDFDPSHALARATATFGAIPRPAREVPSPYTLEPAQDGERQVSLRRVGDSQLIMLAFHVPSGTHPDAAAIDVMAGILGDTPSGRLYKALVETKLATNVDAYGYQLHDPGVFMIDATLRNEDSVDAAMQALLGSIEQFAAAPPTAEEVTRAKDQLTRAIEMTLRDSQRTAQALSESSARGDWRYLFLNRDRREAVTPADVQRVAALYLKEANRTTGVYRPSEAAERVEVPAVGDLLASVAEYKGRGEIEQGEDFEPSPDNIEARTRRFTIPSGDGAGTGIRVSLLPKKTRGATVNANLALHYGDLENLKGMRAVGTLTGGMLMRGTTRRTRQEIADALSQWKVRVSVNGGQDGSTASYDGTRQHLDDALKLIAEILREPSFPAEELEVLKRESVSAIQNSMSEPQTKINLAWSHHFYPYPPEDPRYTPSPEERIAALEKVTIEDVRAFHAGFYGASNAELSIVGDFDPDQVQPLLVALFSGWKSPSAYTRFPMPYTAEPPVAASIETPDKENANIRVGMRIALEDTHADYPALVLSNFIIGGGFLNSRLATRIRQKEGLSYGVSSSFNASPFEPAATFAATAIFAPQNGAALEKAMREELERAIGAGFTAEEVDAARRGYLESRKVSRGQDGDLAARLTTLTEQGRTFDWDKSVEARIAALTADEIGAAIKKHLDVEKMSWIRAGDFARATGEKIN